MTARATLDAFQITVNREILKTLIGRTQPTDTVRLIGPIPFEIGLGVLFSGRGLIVHTGESQ